MKDAIIIIVILFIMAYIANIFNIVHIPWLDAVSFTNTEKQYGNEMKERERDLKNIVD
jgi:hypothetical protein